MFFVKKNQCSDVDLIISSLRSNEGLEVKRLAVEESHEEDCLYFYTDVEETAVKLRHLGSIIIRRKEVLIQECPIVAVTNTADNLPSQVSKEIIVSAINGALDVKIVPHPDASSKSLFYWRPCDRDLLIGRTVRIDGKSHLLSEPVLEKKSIAPALVQPLPEVIPSMQIASALSPSTSEETSGVKFYIDIFHDSENCTCPATKLGLNALKLHNTVVEGVLSLLRARRRLPTLNLDNVKVKWHFFVCSSRQNEYNKPSAHVSFFIFPL